LCAAAFTWRTSQCNSKKKYFFLTTDSPFLLATTQLFYFAPNIKKFSMSGAKRSLGGLYYADTPADHHEHKKSVTALKRADSTPGDVQCADLAI
jgi:hypothetical protein